MLNLNLNVPNPKESASTSRQAKRRSLLPQFARKISEEQLPAEEGIPEDVAGCANEAEPSKATDDADRRAMPPPSKLGRPMSVFGTGGLGRAASVRSHTREASRGTDARADALAALTGSAPLAVPTSTAAQDASLKRTSSTRLPQSPASRGLSRTASVKPKHPPTRTTSTAKPITSISEKRSSVTRARPPSIDGTARARPPSVISPVSPAHSATSRHSTSSRPQSQVLSQPSRPSFSTYQQHYSPAKSALPKPPVPASRHGRPTTQAPEEDTAPTFEIQKQQNELLSLSLLHQAAQRTLQEYTTSAHRKLGRKQARLRKESESLLALENEQLRVASLMALEAWCPDPAVLAENLQVASRIYAELSTLSESSGRYGQLVSQFENWTEGAEVVLSGRDGEARFVEALPQEWHKMHTSLALRLRTLQRDLGVLPPAPRGKDDGARQASGLRVLLESCEGLLGGMLKELELMSKLERGILQREKGRVEDEVKGIRLDGADAGLGLKGKQWVPAWQSVA
ncbi:hypothetical protein B0A55_01551 [Friedmanniomyces simplex]|uniref:Uncharacterized protein n=1 Tax=Friedmanniomyces simplex TaxID=329884 RepID=A0A4U0XYA4_9PEZI|nr:hypothetical protein B0A55_01551 [Friedmanniomyces simplex]